MERVLTKKGAVVELAIVTVGVLIALSFDGARGWMRERSLVDEARANLATELRRNKTAVDRFLTTIPEREKELDTVQTIAEGLIAGRPVTIKHAALGFVLADISSAARTTAEITGAFSLMSYEEVGRYAAIYDHQARFGRMQDDFIARLTPVLSRVWLIESSAPPRAEAELWLRDIYSLGAHLLFVKQLGEQLSRGYGEAIDQAD